MLSVYRLLPGGHQERQSKSSYFIGKVTPGMATGAGLGQLRRSESRWLPRAQAALCRFILAKPVSARAAALRAQCKIITRCSQFRPFVSLKLIVLPSS